ncbi:DUF4352 domain-containing protein [Bacillus toyonensis]|uniref:DUF4352 domain-containing protein n=1 Tax=Bacillus toyonensis TaxID=155322 RepID=UPI000A19C5E5|nr:DUF4352 domain-containing protein [Bacillus toyonensis]MCU4770176.1 DUF4352 domain-containing protein [Bacillus toyonensis]MED2710626.1 DUF4352 domain-containing protein [Bacillus toyonensis]MED2742064.1 DUF4352 domain-containing protein [Bacillus toyonensis]OSM10413.1 hypothetical protein BTH38_25535 [Bacillus toyonensis]PEK40247.1 DUF4352 domain-containing protein [Bacillus toyonensis]
MYKKLGTIALTGALAFSLAACGETEVKEVSKNDAPKQEEKKDKKASTENKVYKIGDTVEINGLQLTFNSAQFVEANEYSKAEKGKVLEITFSAKNNGKKDAYIGTEELKIADAGGNQFKEYFGAENAFMNENVGPGNQITGKMYFDVAESDKYTGTYKPNFTFDEKSVKFEFTPAK